MKTQIILGALLLIGIIIIYFLHKYSVNHIDWYSSFKYPEDKGDYLIQDYDTKKFEVATYDNGWFFKGAKPKHFKWRKLEL